MASIVIKDLPESVDLDRKAMKAISGGARIRGRPVGGSRSIFRNDRVVTLPGSGVGFARGVTTDSKGRK